MEQFLDGASIMTFFQLAIGKELLSLISDVFVYENFSIIKYAGPIADVWCNMKSGVGRSSSRKGTMGAGRDNYILHLHGSRERV